ncbi:cytochrome c biogenesis protein CcsA [bacterium]|nr:cytochrome c biogenesis protein CcsA [bacterium]
MEPVLYEVTLWTFFAGMLLHFIGLLPKEGSASARWVGRLALLLIGLGWASLTVTIAGRWLAQGRVPISSSYEYLSFLAWFVALFYFIVMFKARSAFVGACVSPGIFLAVVFAGMYPQRLEMTLVPALQSYWLKIHVSMTIIGEAAFAVAFVTSVLYLIKNAQPEKVSREAKTRSLLLLAVSLSAGMLVCLGLRAAGITLTGLGGVQLFISLMGGAFLLAVPIYILLWRRLVGGGPGNYGGLLFALSVLALLASGMTLGSLVNRSTEKMQSLAARIQAVDELSASLPAGVESLDEALWSTVRQTRQERLDLFLALEALHARTKHTLSREDAAEVLAAHPQAGETQFPLTLGEIREERRGLQQALHEQDNFIREAGLPLSLVALQTRRNQIIQQYNSLFQESLLPLESGREAAFIGYMLLLALPFYVLFAYLSGRLRPRVPSLETLDSMSYRTVSLGFPIFTFGALIAGAVWAHYAWGKWWSNDPKEMGSLIVWLVFLVYLHARYVRRWSGNQSAVAAILGFLFAVLTFVGNSVLGGLHSYG